jgi:hypothetical protein
VLLEETFTPAERTLVEHGDKEPIEQIRLEVLRRRSTGIGAAA